MKANQYLVKENEKKGHKVIYLRCCEEVYDAVHERADSTGVSTNSFVNTAVKFFLDTLREEEPKRKAK